MGTIIHPSTLWRQHEALEPSSAIIAQILNSNFTPGKHLLTNDLS